MTVVGKKCVMLRVPWRREACRAIHGHKGKHAATRRERQWQENTGKSVYCGVCGKKWVRQSKQAGQLLWNFHQAPGPAAVAVLPCLKSGRGVLRAEGIVAWSESPWSDGWAYGLWSGWFAFEGLAPGTVVYYLFLEVAEELGGKLWRRISSKVIKVTDTKAFEFRKY